MMLPLLTQKTDSWRRRKLDRTAIPPSTGAQLFGCLSQLPSPVTHDMINRKQLCGLCARRDPCLLLLWLVRRINLFRSSFFLSSESLIWLSHSTEFFFLLPTPGMKSPKATPKISSHSFFLRLFVAPRLCRK